MFSQLHVIWSLMRGHRLRYGVALLCIVAATLLITACRSSAARRSTTGGRHAVGADHPRADRPSSVLFGGAAFLRTHLCSPRSRMVVLTAAGGLFSYIKGWQVSLASDGTSRQLKDRLYDHLNHLPAHYHDRADTGDLVQRCTSDVETARLFLASQVVEIVNAVILGAIALPLMLSLNAGMTLVSFSLILPIVAYGYFYFRSVKHVFREVEQAKAPLPRWSRKTSPASGWWRAFARHDFERASSPSPTSSTRDRNRGCCA